MMASPLANAVSRRVRRACQGYLSSQLVSPFFDAERLSDGYWRDLVDEAGVELEEVIRIRPDTRGVFVVQHPRWGRCVLKTSLASRNPRMSLSNQVAAQIVSESRSPIFPKVYEATLSYTLDEYIDGYPFRDWADASFAPGPAADYLSHLKAWSLHHVDPSSPTLSPVEIRDLCRLHIEKCLGHARYFSAVDNVRSTIKMLHGEALKDKVEWLWEEAGRLRLPKALMCGDMGNVNVLVQKETHRLYNIDYEFVGIGHWGFDCGYFLSSLAKMSGSEAAVDGIRAALFEDDYLGDAQTAQFFRTYTDVLTEISMALYGPAGRDGSPPDPSHEPRPTQRPAAVAGRGREL